MAADSKDKGMRRGLRLASSFLFTGFLVITLLSYHVYHLTSFSMVKQIGLAATSEMLNVQSLAEIYYSEFVELAGQDPEANLVVPGLGVDLGVKAKDLNNVPKDKIGEFIAGSIIKRIYYEGFSNVYDIPPATEANQDSLYGMAYLVDAFVNKDFNDRVYLAFIISALLAMLFAVPLFRFSHGYQKLTGFGGSFIVAGAPGILLAITQYRMDLMMQGGFTSGLLDKALLPFLKSVEFSYLTVLLVGVGLFLAGMSGIFITKRRPGLEDKGAQPYPGL